MFTDSQRNEFKKLYEDAVSAKDERLVKIKDDLLRLLCLADLARIKYMHCKTVVPHNMNRGGSKMQVHKIYEKGSKIMSVGVSLDACGPSRAVAFEVNPMNKKIASEFVKYSDKIEHFANYIEESVEAGSVGCGHWNQFLAAIHDKALVPQRFIKKLCETGHDRLDPERLCRDQPALRQLLQNGLQFTVIKHSVETQWPQLPFILQKALNVEHHIGEGQHLCVDSILSQ